MGLAPRAGAHVVYGTPSLQELTREADLIARVRVTTARRIVRVGSPARARPVVDVVGPAVEVDVTTYLDNGEQESKLLFVGPTAQAIHEAQRRCMIEDVGAILGRQFDKAAVAQVTALVNEMFDRDWKEKASQQKKPERAFETYPRPSRKNLH